MKRFIKTIVVSMMVISLTACKTKDNDVSTNANKPTTSNTPKEVVDDLSGLSEEEILDKYIKDMDAIDPNDYFKMINCLSNYSYDEDLWIEECPLEQAMLTVHFDGTLNNPQDFVKQALKANSPLVKGEGLDQFSYYYDECSSDQECVDALKELVKTEEDPYALHALLNNGFGFLDLDPSIKDKALALKDSEYAPIRNQSIKYVLKDQDEQAIEYLKTFIKDEDSNVRQTAFDYVGRFNDESLIPLVVESINDPSQIDSNWSALSALSDMSMDFPFYEHQSVDAWNAIMDYLSQEVTEKKPSYLDLQAINPSSYDDEEFIAWRDGTEYVDKDAVVQAMNQIIDSDQAGWLTVREAILVVKAFGSDDQYKQLEERIQNRTSDTMKDELLEAYYENE